MLFSPAKIILNYEGSDSNAMFWQVYFTSKGIFSNLAQIIIMNILLLGSGGREHALAWALSKSPVCRQLFIAPGNAGTNNNGTNIELSPTDFEGVSTFCLNNNIGMVVVGPEAPLVAGIVDYFEGRSDLKHIPVIGPSKACAQLEGSKAFSKAFMQRHQIPTAAYKEFTAENINDGLAYIDSMSLPIVLKADGLAAGKGVLICDKVREGHTTRPCGPAHATVR